MYTAANKQAQALQLYDLFVDTIKDICGTERGPAVKGVHARGSVDACLIDCLIHAGASLRSVQAGDHAAEGDLEVCRSG